MLGGPQIIIQPTRAPFLPISDPVWHQIAQFTPHLLISPLRKHDPKDEGIRHGEHPQYQDPTRLRDFHVLIVMRLRIYSGTARRPL